MNNLSIHQKINIKSHFNPENNDLWFMRINRPNIEGSTCFKLKTQPFFPELSERWKGWSKLMLINLKK